MSSCKIDVFLFYSSKRILILDNPFLSDKKTAHTGNRTQSTSV